MRLTWLFLVFLIKVWPESQVLDIICVKVNAHPSKIDVLAAGQGGHNCYCFISLASAALAMCLVWFCHSRPYMFQEIFTMTALLVFSVAVSFIFLPPWQHLMVFFISMYLSVWLPVYHLVCQDVFPCISCYLLLSFFQFWQPLFLKIFNLNLGR